MFRIIVGLGFMFVVGTLLSAMFSGNSGFVSTTLTADIDADDTTVHVSSVDGFLPGPDVIFVESEVIRYTAFASETVDTAAVCGTGSLACFTGATRGRDNTTASSHLSSARVYTETLGTFDTMMGFNVSESFVAIGNTTLPVPNPVIWSAGFKRLVTADYAFFDTNIGQMVAAFSIYIIVMAVGGFLLVVFVQVLQGLISRVT